MHRADLPVQRQVVRLLMTIQPTSSSSISRVPFFLPSKTADYSTTRFYASRLRIQTTPSWADTRDLKTTSDGAWPEVISVKLTMKYGTLFPVYLQIQTIRNIFA